MPKDRERIEVTFNTKKDSDREMLDFIDANGSSRAGFIKTMVRHYMNNIQPLGSDLVTNKEIEKNSKPNAAKNRSNKKKLPKLGSSFSSKDFEN